MEHLTPARVGVAMNNSHLPSGRSVLELGASTRDLIYILPQPYKADVSIPIKK